MINPFRKKKKKNSKEHDQKIDRTVNQYSRSKINSREANRVRGLLLRDADKNHYAEMIRIALSHKR